MILYDSLGNEVSKGAATAISATAAVNTALTLSIPVPPAGQFNYITSIHISRQANAALAGSAILQVTTTNLPGSLAWSTGNALAVGETKDLVQMSFAPGIKSSTAATATTIVMPAPGAGVAWRASATYFQGP